MTPLLPKGAFSGLVVWITGASSGIGKEMALMLAERGARLVLSSRRKESLEKVAEECRKHNSDAQVKIVVLDLNDMPSLASKAKEAAESFGEAVDVMINNGGVGTRAVARESSVGVDEYLIQVDYLSHVCLTKSVLPGMEQKSDARIINMGSIASKMGVPARTAYCGAKHALVGFMEALRGECILHGHDHIHVLNAIVGSTDTPLPLAAVTDVSGSTIETFGEADKNISNGMSVVCDGTHFVGVLPQDSGRVLVGEGQRTGGTIHSSVSSADRTQTVAAVFGEAIYGDEGKEERRLGNRIITSFVTPPSKNHVPHHANSCCCLHRCVRHPLGPFGVGDTRY